jgi:pimeloyl-ACP methyl ester carboxylesterase
MHHTIHTKELAVAYLTSGPASGFPVLLLHGWPDDALTWNRVGAHLAASGYRVIAPYLRGCGPTRFLRDDTPRSGQLAVLGQDVVQLAEALQLNRYAMVGHDWGARAAYIAAHLESTGANAQSPRITHCVGVSVGYGTNSPSQTLSWRQTQNYWYHWFMGTPRGQRAVREDRHAFMRHIWDEWCPYWKVDDAEFSATAASFNNVDWADIVLHSYNVRWGHAAPYPQYAALEAQFDPAPKLNVPTLTLHGADDPVNGPATSANKEEFFTTRYARKLVERCGHFPQREHPNTVANEVIAWLRG